jgi:hypothetical protein
MIVENRKCSPAYGDWLGKQVVLLVVIRENPVPMPCSIVSESLTSLRILVEPGWEMDVRKDLILAVEEDFIFLDKSIN